MTLLDYLPFDPTGPLNLPSKYKDRPLAYFHDKYIWLKKGIEGGFLDETAVTAPAPASACKPERMADNFLAAWTDENGKPQRRVITKARWIELGGRNE